MPAARNDPMAGWALGVSIFTLLCCVLGAPVAIGLGVSSQRRIDASGGWLTGRGMATAGIVIGAIGTGLLVVQGLVVLSGGSGVLVGF